MSSEPQNKPLRRNRLVIFGAIVIAVFVFDFATGLLSGAINNAVRFRAMMIAQKVDNLWENTFFDVPVGQYPADFMTYQEIIWTHKPEMIVETGTWRGGTAAYLASLLMLVNPEGKVVTIDIDDQFWKQTLKENQLPKELLDRIIFIKGDSVGDETLAQVREHTKGKKTLVILDSLHTRAHVTKELELYSPLIPVGGYIIVNDSQLEWAHWREFWNNGPASGRDDFLDKTDAYELDVALPRSFITVTKGGYIKRVK